MSKNPEFKISHTEQRKLRIKMASAVLNMHTIAQEMQRYDFHALQKSAAVGARRGYRIKYAALVRQYELEKQAFVRALGQLARKALPAVGRGIGRAGRNVGKAVRRFGGSPVGKAVNAGTSAYGAGEIMNNALEKVRPQQAPPAPLPQPPLQGMGGGASGLPFRMPTAPPPQSPKWPQGMGGAVNKGTIPPQGMPSPEIPQNSFGGSINHLRKKLGF